MSPARSGGNRLPGCSRTDDRYVRAPGVHRNKYVPVAVAPITGNTRSHRDTGRIPTALRHGRPRWRFPQVADHVTVEHQGLGLFLRQVVMRRRYLQQLNSGSGSAAVTACRTSSGAKVIVGRLAGSAGVVRPCSAKNRAPATIGGTQRRSAADRQVPDVVVEHLRLMPRSSVSCGHRRRPLSEVWVTSSSRRRTAPGPATARVAG